MKNFRNLLVVIAFIAGVTTFNSCSKEDVNTDVVAKTTVQDYINTINSFSLATVDELTSNENANEKSVTILDCLTVTIHENEAGEFWPRNWTLDYGSENCECFTGNMKRGKINVSISDWWKNEGSLKEITFEDFYLNDNKMEGIKTSLNTGLNDSGNLTFTKNVTDAKLTYPDATSMTWTCEKFSEQIEGRATILFADDVWSVTGGGSGVNLDGKSFTTTISSALIYKNGCFYPISGIIEIATDDEDLKVINYGDGECDNIATVTIGNITETVEF